MSVNDTEQLYSHYRDVQIDALQVAQSWNATAPVFSVLKYMQRAGKKDGESHTRDMLKAVWYLTYETAFKIMPHYESVLLADGITDSLRQACQDYLCPTLTAAERDSLRYQCEMNFPSAEASDLPT
jgi:hypothetical protein